MVVAKKEPTIADRLKALRDKLGLTNAKFAEHLGISPRALHSYMYGERNPSRAALRLIEIMERQQG